MKLLVADKSLQETEDDFFWCTVGEIVVISPICEKGLKNICGCERSFTGLESRKATTTAVVKDVDMSQEEFWELVKKSEENAGFSYDQEVIDDVNSMLKTLDDFEPGDMVESNFGYLNLRKPLL